MKNILFILFLLGAISAGAQNKLPDAKKGSEFGAGVADSKVFDVHTTDQLVSTMNEKDSLDQVYIDAVVTDVCAKKGCWMTLKANDSTTLFVRMKDYGFFVPMNMVGRRVMIDAAVSKKLTSVKELQHYAKDAKKSQAEIDAITEPKEEIRILATGIKVID